jgi:hypothetical protein
MTHAWKDLERRICRQLGGQRSGPTGKGASDCADTPFAVEVKRTRYLGPPVLSKWVLQAKANAREERRPWLVVVAGHHDRRPIVALDFFVFCELAQQAGVLPVQLEISSEPAAADGEM